MVFHFDRLGYFAFSHGLIAVTSLILCVIVWVRGSKSALHLTFTLFCAAIVAWSIPNTFWACSTTLPQAAFYFRWLMANAIFIPILYAHHVSFLVGCERNTRPIIVAGYILAVPAWFSVFTPLFMHNYHRKGPFPFWPDPLIFFHLYFALFSAYVFFAFWLLYRGYTHAEGRSRTQLQYALIGGALGWIGGMSEFFTWYDIPIPPYLIILVSAYVMLTAYAVYKHQLMDIAIIVRRTLIYSILTAMLTSVYMGFIILATQVSERIIGHPQIWGAFLAATCTALGFLPLRNWVQHVVDKKFFRIRADYEAKLVEYSSLIMRETSPSRITSLLYETLADLHHPVIMGLYMRSTDGQEYRQCFHQKERMLEESFPAKNRWSLSFMPAESPDAVGRPMQGDGWVRAAFPLWSQRELLGFLLLGDKRSEQPYTEEDRAVLKVIVNQTAIALERPKLVQEVSGGFVHEIKTPLASITLPAELTLLELSEALRKGNLDASSLPRFQKRMTHILDQVQVASRRLEAMEQAASSEPLQGEVNLREVVGNGLLSLRPLIERARIDVQVKLAGDLPVIQGNAKQLEVVLANLVKNAVEAMSDNPPGTDRRLEVEGTCDGRSVDILVRDTGPGIAPEAMKHLFEPRYTTKGAKGMGMGLYLCQQIVLAHGGTVRISHPQVQGALFKVCLPLNYSGGIP